MIYRVVKSFYLQGGLSRWAGQGPSIPCTYPSKPYGDQYHAYWVIDISKLNDKSGTADDLKELSKAPHDREMLLMVDIVLNHGVPFAIVCRIPIAEIS